MNNVTITGNVAFKNKVISATGNTTVIDIIPIDAIDGRLSSEMFKVQYNKHVEVILQVGMDANVFYYKIVSGVINRLAKYEPYCLGTRYKLIIKGRCNINIINI